MLNDYYSTALVVFSLDVSHGMPCAATVEFQILISKIQLLRFEN